MSGWIVLGVYVVGFLFTYRNAYLAIMTADEDRKYSKPDAEDRAMMAIVAMLASTLWPVTLVGYAIWRFATPVTPGQRKAELDSRAREIERLERELGISRDHH
ncbi:MAG: hypothetical protein H0X12_04045 [Nocardioides sp.]|nr:hypothetical protein [Nocardioides sp.]